MQMWKGGGGGKRQKFICVGKIPTFVPSHNGSSGSMEVAGVNTIYHRSIEKHRLPHTLVMVLRNTDCRIPW